MSQKYLKLLNKFARKGGDIVPVRLGFKQAFLLNHPDYITQVLSERDLFPKFLTTPSRDVYDFVGEGLFNSEWDYWFHQRRKIQPIFHYQLIAAYSEVTVTYTESLLKTWQDGEIRDVYKDMISLTSKIVMKTILNIELSEEEAQNIAHAANELIH
jgi:cytochrome P450